MPKAKDPHREEPPSPSAPSPDATRLATDPGTLTPATNNTQFGFLGGFTTNTEGCTVRFGIEQERYLLALTLPNYNALFSLLLACWLNRCKVSLTYKLLRKLDSKAPLDPNTPSSIVSITALPPSSSGE